MLHEFNAAKLRGVIGSTKSDKVDVRAVKVKEGKTLSYWLNWGTGELCLGCFDSSIEAEMDELLVGEGL